MSAITALTAQNTVGVRAIHGVPAEFLKSRSPPWSRTSASTRSRSACCTRPEIVEVVAWAIDHYGLQQVVLDPVMVATSGDALIRQRRLPAGPSCSRAPA